MTAPAPTPCANGVRPPPMPRPGRAGDPLDLQGEPDGRGVALLAAGVRGVRHPLRLRLRDGGTVDVLACWTLSTPLAADRRGVHMSRFVEAARAAAAAPLAPADWPAVLAGLRRRMGAADACVEAAFPLPLPRSTPVTGLAATAVYDAAFRIEGAGGAERLAVSARVPVATLCPCSKAVSDYGAHNQRGRIAMEIEPARRADGAWEEIWPEEVIASAEASGSAPVYPLLKRLDERLVTMRAFEHPAFVEDVARDALLRWRDSPRAARVRVEVESFESIHAHDAFAVAEWRRGG